MKFFKSNSFYILFGIFAIMLLLAYIFNKGEVFGRVLSK